MHDKATAYVRGQEGLLQSRCWDNWVSSVSSSAPKTTFDLNQSFTDPHHYLSRNLSTAKLPSFGLFRGTGRKIRKRGRRVGSCEGHIPPHFLLPAPGPGGLRQWMLRMLNIPPSTPDIFFSLKISLYNEKKLTEWRTWPASPLHVVDGGLASERAWFMLGEPWQAWVQTPPLSLFSCVILSKLHCLGFPLPTTGVMLPVSKDHSED